LGGLRVRGAVPRWRGGDEQDDDAENSAEFLSHAYSPFGKLLEGTMRSVEPLDVARLPALADGGLGRRVEPENREVSPAREGGEPVGLLALGRLRTHVEVRAPVRVLDRLVARAERGKRLAVGEPRGILCLVERHRPEVGGGNVGGKMQTIARPARQGRSRAVG